ncbi:hypothetical protein P170DRAFT_277704 [Aspergillus steynii IBT 23096]|uniref:Uncharacterized protein n=1 Tax=Aspergillus steynii IBT 23096 TaxID=1392250 RepID=A0A2I2FX83_9EURO|nr:uncharacterized protein P170DRAFT_277704 [Aspergillus steynii IBT 23096]PLB45244.1 hypothetical protein P170DRAFT_277704 [Aspergillus steynii IBT 23096]
MVNWKNMESTDRLFGALIAAHPGIKLDYQGMATYFGQGATYDAIEGRFRRYRKMADELKTEALERGITQVPRGRGSAVSTPRTPRTGRGITKNTPSTRSRKDTNLSNLTSPTRRGAARSANRGTSSMDAICLDGDTSDDENKKADIKKDATNGTADILWGQSGVADVEIVSAPVPAQPVQPVQPAGAMFPKLEDRENSISTFGRVKPSGEDRIDQPFPSAAPATGLNRSDTPLDHPVLTDLFHQAGLLFPPNPAGYSMDAMYMDDSLYNGTA